MNEGGRGVESVEDTFQMSNIGLLLSNIKPEVCLWSSDIENLLAGSKIVKFRNFEF